MVCCWRKKTLICSIKHKIEMIKRVFYRFYYIYYIFFDRFGIRLTPEWGAIFYLGIVVFFPIITCLSSSISFVFMFLIYIVINFLLYLVFVRKDRFIKIIKNQKPIKVYEVIISIFVTILFFALGFIGPCNI